MWISAKLQEESRSTNKKTPCRVKIIRPADYKLEVPHFLTTTSTCKIVIVLKTDRQETTRTTRGKNL